jgi:hypothetical protein
MRLLPGPLLEFTQTSTPDELPEALARSNNNSNINSSSVEHQPGYGSYSSSDASYLGLLDSEEVGKKVMLVFIVGGLSFLEIAAFRHLSNDQNFPFKILLATTKLASGTALLSSCSSSSV